jgi:hypothetical protein
MTTLDQVLHPTPAILAAWQAILKDAGHRVYGPRDDTPETTAEGLEEIAKKTPFTETWLTGIRASGQQFPVNGSELHWSSWEASLHSRVATMRGKNGQKHDIICAGIYVLSARYKSLFSPAALPFHRILQMKPSGLTPTTEGLLDYTEIVFDIHIEARESAWPDSQN